MLTGLRRPLVVYNMTTLRICSRRVPVTFLDVVWGGALLDSQHKIQRFSGCGQSPLSLLLHGLSLSFSLSLCFSHAPSFTRPLTCQGETERNRRADELKLEIKRGHFIFPSLSINYIFSCVATFFFLSRFRGNLETYNKVGLLKNNKSYRWVRIQRLCQEHRYVFYWWELRNVTVGAS